MASINTHFANPVFENIWQDRYQKNGESYEENLRRVAGFCGKTDEERQSFYQIMREGKFFPGGRTMSNCGVGTRLTLNNCFRAGTRVITKRGLIPIEKVTTDDEVVSEDGLWHHVNAVMTREYAGDLYEINAKHLTAPIVCTPNHQLLTTNGWKRADRLLATNFSAERDWLKMADFRFPKVYSTVDLLDGLELGKNRRIHYGEDGRVCVEAYARNPQSNSGYSWGTYGVYPVNRYVDLTPDFRYFIGRWIGDGSATAVKGKRNPSILQIVFNATSEVDAANRIEDIGNRAFGFPCERAVTKQNVITLRWSNEIVCAWFKREFGCGCSGKRLPDKYMGDFEIFKGLFDADGCIDTHGAGKIVLKNKSLIEWSYETLVLNGMNPMSLGKVPAHPDTYAVTYSTIVGKGRLNQHLTKQYHDARENALPKDPRYGDYFPIDSINIIENAHETVYNLSVEEVHSYTANGAVVHNCFVAPQIPDDLSGIFDMVKLGAVTHQRGGGIGYDFSRLRPEGTPTSNDAIASGPVSFANVFNAQTATILQGNRRGANMGVLNIYHPDIEQFITAKSYEAGILNYFNLSVMVDDAFMQAAQAGEEITLHWPVYGDQGEILRDPAQWQITKKVNAGALWDSIMRHAYDNGEPGVFFYNNMNRDNTLWYDETIVCSNPSMAA